MAVPLVIPCCQKSLCASDGPVLNLSAEQSDGPAFVGISFGGQNVPPIGWNWSPQSGNPPNNPAPCFVVNYGAPAHA